jgi:gamma-D-glutamyl-L-lysine dipeptidyl-peptidase
MADSLYRCKTPWAPVRKSPDSRSEIVSSLLYGELFTAINQHDEWLEVVTEFDHYQGWVNSLQAAPGKRENRGLVRDPWLLLGNKNAGLLLPCGSEIPEAGSLYIADVEYALPEVGPRDLMSVRSSLLQDARRWIGAPYLWGGRTIWGCDCSGFVQVLAKINGISLPRDAWQQAETGKEVPFEIHKPGDLAFFSNTDGKITHVGMATGGNTLIHASGEVREDLLDEKGIYHETLGRYTHTLHSIRSIT